MTRKARKPYVHMRSCLECGDPCVGVRCAGCAAIRLLKTRFSPDAQTRIDRAIITSKTETVMLITHAIPDTETSYWPIVEYLKFLPDVVESCAGGDGADYLCLTIDELHYHVRLQPFGLFFSILEFDLEVGDLTRIIRHYWLPVVERLTREAPNNVAADRLIPFTLAIGIDGRGNGTFRFTYDIVGIVATMGRDMIVLPLPPAPEGRADA